MERIIIPTNYIHVRSTPLWTKETAPKSIWQRHLDKGTRQGVYPKLSVMQGTIVYYSYADQPRTNRHPGNPSRAVRCLSAGNLAPDRSGY